jgi:hypothetical protein
MEVMDGLRDKKMTEKKEEEWKSAKVVWMYQTKINFRFRYNNSALPISPQSQSQLQSQPEKPYCFHTMLLDEWIPIEGTKIHTWPVSLIKKGR